MSGGKGGCSCFGCLWLVGLVFFSIVEVAALLWLNPGWFDRRAFWRGEIYPPEDVYVVLGDDASDLVDDAPAEPRIVYWEEQAVATVHDTSAGSRIETVEGTRLEFPGRAIRGADPIEVVPVTRVVPAMVGQGINPMGPLHDIRIGGREHYEFDTAATITLPFDPASVPEGGRVTVGTWEGDRWKELPSTVDAASSTVSARMEHASISGALVIGGLVVGGIASQLESGRALYEMLRRRVPFVYKTPNFAIHYDTSVGLGVVPDDEYPLTGERAAGEHPLFVQDVGAWLEESRRALASVGMPLGQAAVIRWDVFCVPLQELGSSGLGGPVLLDNDFRAGGEFMADYAFRMRATCAHELIHVAQDSYFTNRAAARGRWWIEATAEYLAKKCLAAQGVSVPRDGYYLDSRQELLAGAFDEATGSDPYAWSSFFEWLERSGVNAIAAIKAVNGTGEATLKALDGALRREAGGRGLAELFEEFATAFYHENLWKGDLLSLAAVRQNLTTVRTALTALARRTAAGQIAVLPWAEKRLALPHMSATFRSLRVEAMAADRGARVVIHIPGAAGQAGSLYALVAGTRGADFPLEGAPTTLLPILLEGPEPYWVSPRLALPPQTPDDISRISLIVGNAALSGPKRNITIQRWLLMPPEGVAFSRQGTGPYQVAWQESPLVKAGGGGAFKGYNVYRRKKGDESFPQEPVNPDPITESTLEDKPPDDEDHVYAVTVVDRFDNESFLSKVSDRDPFQGVWSGKIFLVKGELTEPVIYFADRVWKEEEGERRRALAEARDAQDRARIRTRQEKELQEFIEGKAKVREVLDKVEELTRLGIPMKFRIGLKDGEYFVRALSFFMQPIEESDSEEAPLVRVGDRTLAPKLQPEGVEPFYLRLHRANEINTVWEFSFEVAGKRLAYGFRYAFERERPD